VLQVVCDHAHQPDAQRHRRVEPRVDYPVELTGRQARDVPNRFFKDRVVVAAKQFSPGPNQSNLVGLMAVADVMVVERQVEPISPTARDPYLFISCNPRDMVILDPGQVPDQPRNGVGLAISPEGQRLCGNAVENVLHLVPDPAKSISEQLPWSQFQLPLKSGGPLLANATHSLGTL
jgi:hypothetical protein